MNRFPAHARRRCDLPASLLPKDWDALLVGLTPETVVDAVTSAAEAEGFRLERQGPQFRPGINFRLRHTEGPSLHLWVPFRGRGGKLTTLSGPEAGRRRSLPVCHHAGELRDTLLGLLRVILEPSSQREPLPCLPCVPPTVELLLRSPRRCPEAESAACSLSPDLREYLRVRALCNRSSLEVEFQKLIHEALRARLEMEREAQVTWRDPLTGARVYAR